MTGTVFGIDDDQQECVFCDRELLRTADVYIENDFCLYTSSRDPRDPEDVMPGCGVVVPIAHRSFFELTADEWFATRELVLAAKRVWDERLAPDAYMLGWNASSLHSHLHVIPRFDDEPCADVGLRSAVKVPENRRPDPWAKGNGRAAR
jgi:histidine triad (HIT) family protein